jgi:hypothetical protein
MGEAVGTRGSLAAPFLLALAVSGVAPGVTHAAEDAEVLPGDPHAAVVADVDGDGAADLVRIQTADARRHVVDAWSRSDGAWERIGSTPIPRLDPSGVEERLLPGSDASALLIWHAVGRARVLVVARWGAPANDPTGFPCCLSLFELVARGGDVVLEPIAADGGMAEVLHAVDFDADGTDELVRTQSSPEGELASIEVLRWDGTAFRSLLVEQSDLWMWGVWAGDTDGHAGDDLLIGPTPEGDLRRLAWVDGRIAGEDARVDLGQPAQAWVAAIADGALVVTTPNGLRIVRWPRDEEPATSARREGGSYPHPVAFGAGAETLLAVTESTDLPDDFFSPVTIYDLALDRLGEVAAEPSAARIGLTVSPRTISGRALERYLGPYGGPFPAASGDRASRFAWSGILLEAESGGGYNARSIAPMLGLQPIGLAGPGDAWLVLSTGFPVGGTVAYLYPGMVPAGTGRISVVPMADVLGAERRAATVEVRGAAVVGEPVDGVTELFAGTAGFEVAVTAPPGSWVQAWDGRTMHEPTIEQEPVIVAIAPSTTRQDEDSPIRAWIVVATPSGRATLVEWSGTFVAGGPELDVAGATVGLSFSATVRGVVGPHASVTVDGRPADVDRAGDFATTVEAWPWPRRVEVVARDPIGNEVVERIEVIGLIDYRGLPWPLIGGLASVGAGVALFVHTPRLRSRSVPSSGDGRLEELDPIDGSGFDGR